jgi:dihydrodipicolinate synthase/N-acetylneuraminate lyase
MARSLSAAPSTSKPMRGAFMILSTPYTASKAVDYEDFVKEVDFLDRCGVQGLVWPQLLSEYTELTKEERMRGMEVLAKAAKGRKPALIFGVQADDTETMLEYARYSEELAPDGVIAIPPKRAKSIDDYKSYFRALCKVAKRPVFIQTDGGAPGVDPTTDFIVELAKEFPNFGYVKEEYDPIIPRIEALAKYRPNPIRALFGARYGRGWLYEERYGTDGTMTGGAMYADVYELLWNLHLQNDLQQMREVFSKLLLMLNLDQQIPGVRLYLLKKRGIFKTTVSRKGNYTFSPQAIAEIEYNFEALKPYLKA